MYLWDSVVTNRLYALARGWRDGQFVRWNCGYLGETRRYCLLYRDHCLKHDGLTMGSYFLLYMLVWV